MKSPFYFIIKPFKHNRYVNSKVIGGEELIISTSDEDHRFSNRYGEVVSTPLGYKGKISEGDILLVHHNVFKYYHDMRGRQRSGRSFLRDDLFFVDEEQFFMYKKDGEWEAINRYCFVEPVKAEESIIKKPLEHEPLVGIMRYPNTYLKEEGVKSGDKVSFQPGSEYEFLVDDVKMYRIYDHQVTIKL